MIEARENLFYSHLENNPEGFTNISVNALNGTALNAGTTMGHINRGRVARMREVTPTGYS